MPDDIDRASSALHHIPADLPRPDWHKVGCSALAAGLSIDDVIDWSRPAPNFKSEQDVRASFRTIKPEGGIGPGTLYKMASENGWSINNDKPRHRQAHPTKDLAELLPMFAPGMSPAEVFGRGERATSCHSYVVEKNAAGVPLDGLRVLPAHDELHIAGESMAGALVMPIHRTNGSISSLQFIVLPEVAARLKAKGKPGKLNLPKAKMEGFYTVGNRVPGGVIYVAEGLASAWACWKATGAASVACCGWGRVQTVASELRAHDASARLVLVPDVGKEESAAKIAREVGAAVAYMPDGWPNNSDVSDLAQRDGGDVLAELLEAARAPAPPKPRYKLLTGADLRDLAPLAWRVRGVLPAVGLAALYGPSASGKSFLAFDMAAAIAEGQSWFGCRVEATPVVYAALEGEAGFKLRAQAWEVTRGRDLPDGLSFMMQGFVLTTEKDVKDLAVVIPAGAVVFLDTLNRAAPTADENSSKDMGEILQAAKMLQALTGGLVVLVHHTGKNAAAGLRGHSSLFAAMDAAIEVSRNGDRRDWKVAKSKDGQDGNAYPFTLKVETLGTDEYGDPVTSCVILRDTAAHEVKQAKLPYGGNQRLVWEALRPVFKSGTAGKPGAPPLQPCIELESAIASASKSLICPTDKRTSRTRDAITGLISRGLMGCHEGWLWLK